MNEIQIFGITNYFVITGIVLSHIWAGAYILSWIIQWAWAWVDETKPSSFNWLAIKVVKRKDGWYMNPLGFILNGMFYKYILIKDGKQYNEADYSPSEIIGIFRSYFLVLPLIWFGVFCANYWNISMWFAMGISLAFVARLTRRGQKLLTSHMADKDAHK